MAKSDTENARVSSNWNGVLYTAHASDEAGTKFGTGTGQTEDEARQAALDDLAKDASSEAPEQGGSHSTEADAEQAGAVRAGKTGSGRSGS